MFVSVLIKIRRFTHNETRQWTHNCGFTKLPLPKDARQPATTPLPTPSRGGEVNEMLNCRSMVPPVSLTSLIGVISKISIAEKVA